MDVVMLVLRVALAGIFGLAAMTKLADPIGSRAAMRGFGVPDRLAGPAGIALPIAELAVAILLLPVATAWWAALAGLVLLLVFVAGIAYSLAQGRTPDCHCFGQVYSEPVGWTTLIRNGIFAALAAVLVLRGPERQGSSLVGWLGDLSSAERVLLGGQVLTLAVVAALGWLAFQLLQQQGRLLIRIEALEDVTGVGGTVDRIDALKAATAEAGLPIGADAPDFDLASLDGDRVTLEQLRQGGRPIVLVFTDPKCGPCNALMPDIGRWQRDHAGDVVVAAVSRGGVEANTAKGREHGLTRVLVQQDREVARAYESLPTPSAVLIRPDGTIGSRAALGAEAIRSLIARATTARVPMRVPASNGNGAQPAHRASRIGQPAPDITLPSLSGEEVRLVEFHGTPTFVLFWNPGCGFCKRMLDDLKAWEAVPPAGAPRLLVVSTGAVEANREMGLRAPVLLDGAFATGRTFGASGTPSAVLVDAEGNIASEVAVGAPAVWDLVGGTPQSQTRSAAG